MTRKLKMVFVVCNGRSGSTLLQCIFDSHPNICAPIESKFVLHLATKYRNVKNWDDKKIARFCNDLYTNRKYRLFWGVTKTRLLEHFSKFSIASFQEACKAVYLSWPSVFEKGEIRTIVDKNPVHTRFLPELQAIFPDAKFIHLARDPRAVYSSQQNAFHRLSPYLFAHRWNLGNSLIMDFKKKNPKNFLTIKYEDLVAEPESYIKKTMDFLDVPFYESLLSGHKTLRKSIGKNPYLGLLHHRNIANPIETKYIEKWRNELTAEQTGIIENQTQEVAQVFGYGFDKGILPKNIVLQLKLAQKRLSFRNNMLKVLFKLPFWIRKRIYGMVSLFLDKKYRK